MNCNDNTANTASKIRVMLVDDSSIVRGMVRRILDLMPDIEVVAAVSNGELAIKRMAQGGIEVIVLDIEMPVMDGITAIPLLLEQDPDVKILMSSTLTQRGAEISMRALNLGAADFVAKPTGAYQTDGQNSMDEYRRELVSKVQSLGTALLKQKRAHSIHQKLPANQTSQGLPKPSKLLKNENRQPPRIIAIGSSTGGPQALMTLFKGLDKYVNCPIVLTQHMPPHFTEILAKNIDQSTTMTCREGVDGEPLLAGRIYVAPGNFHMKVVQDRTSQRIALTQEPPENFCRPSVDPMFRSVSQCFGPRTLAIVLTGMGRDGALGVEAIVKAGGCAIAQDEASSVVWGMPGAAYQTGMCSALLPISEIASYINNAARVKNHVA